MFAESLLESSPHVGHRSAYTKVASALLQSVMLLVALAIPLFHIEGLRVVPPPPSIQMTNLRQPMPEHMRASSSVSSIAAAVSTEIVQPRYIPRNVSRASDQETGPPGSSIGPTCAANCFLLGPPVGVLSVGPMVIPPPPNHPPLKPIHVSEMQLGELVRKVLPEYPSIAKQLRIQGPVVLLATVGKDGRVSNVQAVSGPPLLQMPAKRAVEQWQYRPYLLNHEPVIVQTQITVNFVLNRE